MGNSLPFAILTTVSSVVIGTSLAVLLLRTDLPGRKAYRVLVLLPVTLPGLILIIGYSAMWAPSGYASNLLASHTPFAVPFDLCSLTGMAVVGTTVAAPVVYLLARGSLGSMDSSLEDAARASGARPLRALWTVTVPLLRPSLLNASLIVFALSAEALGLPLLLGGGSDITLMSTYLYKLWTGGSPADQGVISAGAVFMLLLVTVLLLVRNRVAGDLTRFATTTGKPRPSAPLTLGRLRWALSAVVGIVLLATTLVPLFGVVLSAFTSILSPFVSPWTVLTTANFSDVTGNTLYTGAIRNSLLIATIGGGIGALLVALLAVIAHRSEFRFRKSLAPIVLYPRAIPGLITGMAFFWTFAVLDRSGGLRSTLWAIGLAFVVRSLALGYSAIYPALAALGQDSDQAARTSGADWGTASTTILFRLLRPATAVGFVLLFVALLNDADPAVFLVTPNTQVLGLSVLQLASNGVGGTVAALGVIQLLITAVVLGLGRIVL